MEFALLKTNVQFHVHLQCIQPRQLHLRKIILAARMRTSTPTTKQKVLMNLTTLMIFQTPLHSSRPGATDALNLIVQYALNQSTWPETQRRVNAVTSFTCLVSFKTWARCHQPERIVPYAERRCYPATAFVATARPRNE